MTFRLVHAGHEFNQEQLTALIPVLNRNARGEIPRSQMADEIRKALEAAGCPLPTGPAEPTIPDFA